MKFDYTLIIKICEGFAIIVSYIIIAILGVFLKQERDQKKNNQNEEDPHVTHKQLSDRDCSIFVEMDKRIEKATCDKATKESIANLQNNFTDLKKNVETKFDQFQVTLQQMAVNVAVLAERRSKPREDEG